MVCMRHQIRRLESRVHVLGDGIVAHRPIKNPTIIFKVSEDSFLKSFFRIHVHIAAMTYPKAKIPNPLDAVCAIGR